MKKILRKDLVKISNLIESNETVLDVGCGDGNLIRHLSKKNVDCRGIEITLTGVGSCLEKGLNVIQGDANYDLEDYPDNSFSTVILSQTIQAMIYPDRVIENLIRIGDRAIISFPNFGYWKVRRDFLFSGRMPKNKILPFEWHNTPNIHLCSYRDFYDFCKKKKILVEKFYCLNENGDEINNRFLVNLLTYQVIFCVSKK
ncbi:MAG: methionine biosynthesis protein MetW [Alphaproteobacteria bacterium]|nr:methionine biosynthesis protein MetW [Alphaproteobacteria bacterium]